MFLQKLPQIIHHRAFKNADSLAVQCRRIHRDGFVGIVFDQTVDFIAHRRIRITDERFAFFLPCQTGQKIDLAVQKHLIQITEITIDILVSPTGVFREFLIILISVSGLDGARLCAFLEHFVLIVADADRLFVIIGRPSDRT